MAAVATLLPLIFAVAHFPGWRQPLEVVAFFGAAEVALSNRAGADGGGGDAVASAAVHCVKISRP